MVHVIGRDIDGGETFNVVADDDIHLQGKIDGRSVASLTSRGGSITIDGKIDGASSVTLTATNDILIGSIDDPGASKVDGASSVTAISAEGRIELRGKIDGASSAHFSGWDAVQVGTTGGAGDRKIDNNSTARLSSQRGRVEVNGKIDANCIVEITAHSDVTIGSTGDAGDRKIDNNCDVVVQAGGRIDLGGKIGGKSTVDLRACDGITIADVIEGSSQVRLASRTGGIQVTRSIRDERTSVEYWPESSLEVADGIIDASVQAVEWIGGEWHCVAIDSASGSIFRNWGWTHGFIARNNLRPQSLKQLTEIVQRAGAGERIKATGGRWSFGDIALPFEIQDEVDQVSIARLRGPAEQDLRNVLQGLGGTRRRAMDLRPQAFERSYRAARRYDQAELKERVHSGPNLHVSDERYTVVDTRALASSLQAQLGGVLTDEAAEQITDGKHYFWVEAGITMAELNTVLDHANPRLALQASGGSPGATLAGTLATATHGGEFRWPLLVDMVRAIHLVGPGGEQWWVEGRESIAEFANLNELYSDIDEDHFITSSSRVLDDLTGDDILNAVIVSLGAMGIVYSVVLEVVEQYGLEQRTVPIPSWTDLMDLAGTDVAALRSSNADANQAILDLLLDGARNGTGIAEADNVYVDLAINPMNRACWVVNRQVTPSLPTDANPIAANLDTYLSSASEMLGRNSKTAHVSHHVRSSMVGRLHDFLHYGTHSFDVANNIENVSNLLSFVTSRPPELATLLAVLNAQAVLNVEQDRDVDRGHQFLADVLDTVLHALQGTSGGNVASTTGVAYQVGAIGWPDGGIPGRALEVALAPDVAFSYLQNVIFDGVLDPMMTAENNPLIGYISIRVCSPTRTFMGMQQFAPHSVMVEFVGSRTVESNRVMDEIARETLRRNRVEGLNSMLHWGLETDEMTADDLDHTPLTKTLTSNPGYRQIDAMRDVRQMLLGTHEPVFDNNFVRRLGL